MNEDSLQSNAECLGTPLVRFRQRVLLSRWVNEPFPPWDQILTAHEVARLARRPPWLVSGMAVIGRFPRKHRFRGRGIGWLRSDVLSWLAQDHRRHAFRPDQSVDSVSAACGQVSFPLVPFGGHGARKLRYRRLSDRARSRRRK